MDTLSNSKGKTMSAVCDNYRDRVKMRSERYACPNQLLKVVEDMDFDFASWLTDNVEYNRWDISGRRRYWRKLSMPVELRNWFESIEDLCKDSR